jgi:mannose-1-phosphate guanylyltransferase (GDP) (EC 2.7.7.22)
MMSITTQNNYQDIVSVILSGGSGTRLWPLSRAGYPKQFLPLVNNQSLLQASVLRLQNPISPSMASHDVSYKSTLVIGNNRHRFLIAEQLQEINVKADILLEPVARNTAPAIAIAAWKLQKQGRQDAIMVVMPSDHLIDDTDSFQQSLRNSIDVVNQGNIVTFGIVPRSAEVGYGYIKAQSCEPQSTVYDVEKFVEKPTIDKANQYLESGHYFWNSGIFCFTAKTINVQN